MADRPVVIEVAGHDGTEDHVAPPAVAAASVDHALDDSRVDLGDDRRSGDSPIPGTWQAGCGLRGGELRVAGWVVPGVVPSFDPPPSPPVVTLYLSSSADGFHWAITASVSLGDNLGLSLLVVDLIQHESNPQLADLAPGVRPSDMIDFDRPDGISNPALDGYGSAYGGTQSGAPGRLDLVQIGGAQNALGVPGDGIGLDVAVDGGVGQEPGGRLIASGGFLAPCTPGTYEFSLASAVANVFDDINDPFDIGGVAW